MSKTCQWGNLFFLPLEARNLYLIHWKTTHSSFTSSNKIISLSEDGCVHGAALEFSREDQTGTLSIQAAAWNSALPSLNQFWNPVFLLCLCELCLLHLNSRSTLLFLGLSDGPGGGWGFVETACWCPRRWDALPSHSERHLHRHCLPLLGSGAEHRML